jgi:hypothetical protein
MWPRDIEYIQNRTLLISGKQTRVRHTALTLLLSQQSIIVLHDRTLHRALNLRGQPIFQIKTPGDCLRRGRAINQSIQRVIVVPAEQRFTIGQHGLSS